MMRIVELACPTNYVRGTGTQSSGNGFTALVLYTFPVMQYV